jgi:hypothetical protein
MAKIYGLVIGSVALGVVVMSVAAIGFGFEAPTAIVIGAGVALYAGVNLVCRALYPER